MPDDVSKYEDLQWIIEGYLQTGTRYTKRLLLLRDDLKTLLDAAGSNCVFFMSSCRQGASRNRKCSVLRGF